jgi:hypothetical protein
MAVKYRVNFAQGMAWVPGKKGPASLVYRGECGVGRPW